MAVLTTKNLRALLFHAKQLGVSHISIKQHEKTYELEATFSEQSEPSLDKHYRPITKRNYGKRAEDPTKNAPLVDEDVIEELNQMHLDQLMIEDPVAYERFINQMDDDRENNKQQQQKE